MPAANVQTGQFADVLRRLCVATGRAEQRADQETADTLRAARRSLVDLDDLRAEMLAARQADLIAISHQNRRIQELEDQLAEAESPKPVTKPGS